MSRSSSPQEVVLAFAQRHGINNLIWGKAGTAALRLPDGMEICFEEIKQSAKLFVYLELGKLPQDERRMGYLERMLHLNCLEQGTFSGTLAVDETTDAVLWQTSLALADLNTSLLEQTMEALLEHRADLVASLTSHDNNELQKIDDQKKKKMTSTMARLERLNKQGETE